jgi:hypothetical protein
VIPLTVPVNVGDADRTTLPVPVEVVTPVPPDATPKVPANTTDPVVEVCGVKPVRLVENEVTPELVNVYVEPDTDVVRPVLPPIVNVPPPATEPDPEPAAKVIVVDTPAVVAEVTRP